METILSDTSVSITELKRNPSAVIEAAAGEPVAVLIHNKPSAYLVPAATYERIVERLDDLGLVELVHARAKERRTKLTLDDLLAESAKSPATWPRDEKWLRDKPVGRERL
ncbi:MAG: type II toxin-antitoxin system prevent-host-death family antitoxin [Proteobacteria bacterium]|nr:type II toxin-antitoxin system prevent-host-death family antitoxin [Pseudomonadota bacterium]